MRTITFSAVSIFLLATANNALSGDTLEAQSSKINGVISLWGGAGLAESTDSDLNIGNMYGFGGEARVSLFDHTGFGVQLDARGEFLYDFPLEDSAIFDTGAHLIYSDMDDYALGLFGGLGHSEMPGDASNVTYVMAGVEAAYYTGDFKLFGQAGLTDFTSTNDSNSDLYRNAWFGRAGAAYAVNEQTLVSGDFTFTAGDTDSQSIPDNGRGFLWELELEHQFSANASAFIGYSGSYFENLDDDEDYSDNLFKLGFKLRLGENSIRQSEKYVPFDLPNLGRIYAVSEEVD